MIHVALAYFFNAYGEVLIARRPNDKMFGGLWEFPGGKPEKEESASAALIRELYEELSIRTEVVKILRSYEYPVSGAATLCFHPILVEHVSGEMRLREHSMAAWVVPSSIENYSLAPPDYEAARILQEYVGDKDE